MEPVSSIFSQIVKLCPRGGFDDAVARHGGEKHARGMTCWSQFIAMLFCHLGGARSLREITGGLAASEGKLRHLGVERAPTRSTLACANKKRSWRIYETVFQQLTAMCQVEAREKKARFRFKGIVPEDLLLHATESQDARPPSGPRIAQTGTIRDQSDCLHGCGLNVGTLPDPGPGSTLSIVDEEPLERVCAPRVVRWSCDGRTKTEHRGRGHG
jgi:hypothetical protein